MTFAAFCVIVADMKDKVLDLVSVGTIGSSIRNLSLVMNVDFLHSFLFKLSCYFVLLCSLLCSIFVFLSRRVEDTGFWQECVCFCCCMHVLCTLMPPRPPPVHEMNFLHRKECLIMG